MVFGQDLRFESILFDNYLGLKVKKEIFRLVAKNFKIQYLEFYKTQGELKQEKYFTALNHILHNRSTGKMAAVGGITNKIIQERTAEFYGEYCPELKRKILAQEFETKKTIKEWHGDIAAYFMANCK